MKGLGLVGTWRGQSCCPDKTACATFVAPLENPSVESCEGGFLHSSREQMRGFHDLLRQKPSCLIVLGWSSISVALLMIWAVCLCSMESMLVLYRWMWYSSCYCALPWLTCLNVPARCDDGAPSIRCWSNGLIGCIFSSRSSLTELEIFHGRRPASLMFCWYSIPLKQLKIHLK